MNGTRQGPDRLDLFPAHTRVGPSRSRVESFGHDRGRPDPVCHGGRGYSEHRTPVETGIRCGDMTRMWCTPRYEACHSDGAPGLQRRRQAPTGPTEDGPGTGSSPVVGPSRFRSTWWSRVHADGPRAECLVVHQDRTFRQNRSGPRLTPEARTRDGLGPKQVFSQNGDSPLEPHGIRGRGPSVPSPAPQSNSNP